MRLATALTPTVLERPIPTKGLGWAVVNLTETAEHVLVDEIERDLHRHLPNAQFFFPSILNGFPNPRNPLSLYVFVYAALDAPVTVLERSRFVLAVLRTPDGRQVVRVSDAELHRALRTRLRDRPEIGGIVTVLAGDWAGLEGRVVDYRDGKIIVYIELWSKRVVLKLQPQEVD